MPATTQKQPPPNDLILTMHEASKYLKVSERSLAKLVKDDAIPHFRVGRLIRFNVAELLDWAKNQSQPA